MVGRRVTTEQVTHTGVVAHSPVCEIRNAVRMIQMYYSQVHARTTRLTHTTTTGRSERVRFKNSIQQHLKEGFNSFVAIVKDHSS